jgi:hypothetical protein
MGMPPLAVQALDEKIELPAGEYLFAAQLTKGGSPAAGRLKFYVSNVAALKNSPVIAYYGLPENVLSWFKDKNVRAVRYEPGSKAPGTVLVGCGASEDFSLDPEALFKTAENGGTVIFLEDIQFFNPQDKEGREKKTPSLPFDAGPVKKTELWLYHIDCIAKPHPVFEGVPSACLMDPEYTGAILPQFIRGNGSTPVNVLCGAFGLGQMVPGGYNGGVAMGEYVWGKGRIILNNLRLLDGIGVNPVAERIVLNMACKLGGV